MSGAETTVNEDRAAADAVRRNTDPPRSAMPANAVQMPQVPLMNRLPYFSMRNGRVSDATSLLVKATIPATYHWRVVTGLPPRRAMENVGAFVRTAYIGIAAHLPPGMAPEKMKKLAIVLGVARATITALYEVGEGDLIPGESAPAFLRAVHTGDGSYAFVATPAVTAPLRAALAEALEFTAEDQAAMASVHMSAIGLPALQGWSLIMTQHHYLSDRGSQSRRAYAAVEKQFWTSVGVKAWWDNDLELVTDALWHKVGHPISITLKHEWATSMKIKEMITNASAGSAAARLPAMESELRAANSYLTCLNTVKNMYTAYGGKLDFSVLQVATDLVGGWPHVVTRQSPAPERGPDYPAEVVSRKTALALLSKVMEANSDVVAHAYGFYCAMSDHAVMMGSSQGVDSIKCSHSLTKLKNQSAASFLAGQTTFKDFDSFTTRRRNEGRYDPAKLEMVYVAMTLAESGGTRAAAPGVFGAATREEVGESSGAAE